MQAASHSALPDEVSFYRYCALRGHVYEVTSGPNDAHMCTARPRYKGKGIACPIFGTSGNEKGGFLREEPAFPKGLFEIGAYTMP